MAKRMDGRAGAVARPNRPITVRVFTAPALAKHLAEGWGTEQIASGKVAVLNSRSFEIRCNDGDTAATLKRKIQDTGQLSAAGITLQKGTRVIHDSMTLHEAWVTDGCTVLAIQDFAPNWTPSSPEVDRDGCCVRDTVNVTQTQTEAPPLSTTGSSDVPQGKTVGGRRLGAVPGAVASRTAIAAHRVRSHRTQH
eukprot:Sspe_Gene.18423::Locus_6609_Transcript_1_1_Confidence_1.000_Length_3119::g.18423::m.18423